MKWHLTVNLKLVIRCFVLHLISSCMTFFGEYLCQHISHFKIRSFWFFSPFVVYISYALFLLIFLSCSIYKYLLHSSNLFSVCLFYLLEKEKWNEREIEKERYLFLFTDLLPKCPQHRAGPSQNHAKARSSNQISHINIPSSGLELSSAAPLSMLVCSWIGSSADSRTQSQPLKSGM